MAKGERYSRLGPLEAFGFLENAMFDSKRSPDGDINASFPRSDAEDLSRGLRFIPGEVTLARRRGEKAQFVTTCKTSTTCWYWQMPDGSRIYHYDPAEHKAMKEKHGGKCPDCGNANIFGGKIPPPKH